MELYVHLPFCRSKCRYCDFASWAGHEAQMSAYVQAVLREAAQYDHPEIETFFLGGGTPSVLPAELLGDLLGGLRERFSFRSDAECTSEANPGTLTDVWLETAVSHGINRLSMGMQTTQPHLLHTLGRIHTMDQVIDSVHMARKHGIGNINLDLMFGLPGQTLSDWQETLSAALDLSPQHLSCYGLIPEEDTPLKMALDEGTLTLPDEDAERQMYDDAIRMLAANGFQQYEISNFALPGYACRHNLGYWRQVPYIGLGASAASMLPDASGQYAYLRKTNPRQIADYLSGTEAETEGITREDAMFETMMLGLRTTRGVSEAEFEKMHGLSLSGKYGSQLFSLEQRGLVLKEEECWALTRRGMDIQNSILTELME